MKEMVDHPSHYRENGIEAIDVIEAFGLGFHLGNAVKYVLRAGRKIADGEDAERAAKTDVKKAIWYLKRYAYEGARNDA